MFLKFQNQIFEYSFIRRTSWIIIIIPIYIMILNSMSRCVCYKKDKFLLRLPIQVQTVPQTTSDIFWTVSSSLGMLFLNEFFDLFNIFCKIDNRILVFVTKISISDKWYSHFQVHMLLFDILNNLIKCIFCSLHPLLHTSCAITD